MTARQPLRWMPDPVSARILAAYRLQREGLPSVLRRALLLLAQADGVVDGRGHVVTDRERAAGRQP
ncbi:hypothetical protein MUK60_07585 [Streptomyces sp. LRE541]|uniref:hypothetical protein n=1 Tax=Streptomyces sp. LRE541 TaxID=2931983 RepID=UPI002010333E|nr:hypothetical protein [Streptomyces sp. LRE541]UPZ27695.1 hypothetical protein MUK60_07585 [Streptomyces sp. LRE541]